MGKTGRIYFSIAAFLPVLLSCAPARADVVVMRNGDRLTGKVVAKEKNLLQFNTGYAGVLRIEWDQVRELRTDEAVLAIFDDGSEYRTRVVAVDGDRVTVTPSEGGAPLTVGRERVSIIRRPAGEPESRAGKVSGLVNLTVRSERGNTDSDEIGVDVDLTYRRDVHRFRLDGEWDEALKEGEKTKEKLMLGATYSRFFTERVYFMGWLRFERDEFANLDLRTSTGPHVGYQFFESTSLNLLTEVGVILVWEDYSAEPNNTYWGPGWHILFDKYLLGDSLQVYHEQYGLLNTEDRENWLWKSWTGLRVPLFGGLLGSAEAKFDYDGDPSEDTEGTQATYRVKLGYRW